jgi:hypothetical protein
LITQQAPPKGLGKERRVPLSAVILACLLVAALGTFYWLARSPFLSGQSDDVVYITSAKTLASGQGYVWPQYPDEPTNTLFPPGYPAFLAALWGFNPAFPANLTALHFVSLLLAAALLALGALVVARVYRADALTVALSVALASTTLIALIVSTVMGSDTLYGVLGLAAMLLVRDGARRPRRLLLGSLCAAAGFYVRTIGITLIIACAVVGVQRWRRRCWVQGACLLWPVLATLPWLVWTTIHGGSTYVALWRGGIPGYAPPIDGPGTLASIMANNVWHGGDILWNVAPVLIDVPLVGTLLLGWVLLRAWQRWRQSGDLTPCYVGVYILLLLAWPWRAPGRFLWPLAPLLAADAIQGLHAVWRQGSRWWGGRLPNGYLAIVMAVLAINVVVLGVAAVRLQTNGDIRDPGIVKDFRARLAVADYLTAHVAPGAVLGTNHLTTGSWWWLYTGHQTLDGVARADGQGAFFRAGLPPGDERLIDYFIYEPSNGLPDTDDWPVVRARLAARGARLDPIYCAEGYTLCVYDWRPSPQAAAR